MIEIVLGAVCPKISEQLEEQGLKATGMRVDTGERLASAITICHIHGVLTDSESTRARKRLLKNLRIVRVTEEV